ALYLDLLINVTSFFRNPEAFDSLKEVVYPALLKGRQPGDTVRIWIPGCSTGEEAYSHAISLVEYLGDIRADYSVQVFGTDLSTEAIHKARAGIYKDSIRSDVTPTRLRRFFSFVEGGYQINKAIRNLCVFAVQNVFRDPPFSRMDIVSCRNVLIYMSPVLQRRVIPILHYALKAKGFLMVGNTEGLLGVGAELFELADKKNKIYRKRPVPSTVQFGYSPERQAVASKPETAAQANEPESLKAPHELQREADRLLLSKYVPAAVVVNEHMEILQTRGHTNRYLELPSGKATLNLLKMARQGLMFELQAAIKDARSQDAAVRRENIQFDKQERVTLEVAPFRAPLTQSRNFLVIFEDSLDHASPARQDRGKLKRAAESPQQDQRDGQIGLLKRELSATKEYLQSIIESQEASNEELQSANEEIQSGNEELQSSNEELQTSKEELESANEELSTVNEEMQYRNLQLTQTTNDLMNFLTSVNIAMVMLGLDLSVRRFTRQAELVFGFNSNDVGRPITGLKMKIDVPDLESQLLNVIHEVRATEQEIQDQNGAWFRLRIAPYRTMDNRIEGAVLTMMDITVMKRSYAELEIERAKLEELLRQLPCGLIIAETPSGKLVSGNARLQEILGHKFSPGDNLVNYAGFALYPGGEKRPQKWALVRAMAGEVVSDEEMEWIRSDGMHVFLSVSAAPIRTSTGEIAGVMATFVDLTFRHSAEEMLRVSEQMAATGRLAAALAHEINNPLEVLTNSIFLLASDPSLGAGPKKYAEMASAELKRIGHISSSLLGLYRRTGASEDFSVQAVVDEVLGLFEAKLAAKKIQLKKYYD
ncbi:MAG TPA: CheR family methyltransferase, partial [Terriglobales bacterium]|nr:CheR family methyltransferase [Terriglobales bacterium]